MIDFRMWLAMSWRFGLTIAITLIIFALPIGYIMFASAPLDPLATFGSWRVDGLIMRLPYAALFVIVISLILGFIGCYATSNMNRAFNHPFQDIATILRQIGTGDFRVRIDSTTAKDARGFAQIHDALNAMAADLERAEELRNNLMADVSHELRTPLTALEGNLRAALDRVYPLGEAEIATLYGQTRHLIRLVNDLHELALADARQLPLAMQPTDLALLLDETLALFAPLADEEQIALRSAIDPLPPLTIDESRIRQVMHNLLTNALRHTPIGGAITVSAMQKQGEIVIAVADTGDGLEPEHINAIFDRFYRADKSRSRDTGGTGLGLAIASALVAAHGGTLAAASAGTGQGSTFTLRLPLRQEKVVLYGDAAANVRTSHV